VREPVTTRRPEERLPKRVPDPVSRDVGPEAELPAKPSSSALREAEGLRGDKVSRGRHHVISHLPDRAGVADPDASPSSASAKPAKSVDSPPSSNCPCRKVAGGWRVITSRSIVIRQEGSPEQRSCCRQVQTVLSPLS